ncbi:autotransporter domain-containing protein [Pseudochelatococcus lubricantis]|uniref:autotransporter domain-containing protein n=1 Tax=Pseudochelatococcus lubricantis TaxID=1538102 RepID=UPI0035ED0FAF
MSITNNGGVSISGGEVAITGGLSVAGATGTVAVTAGKMSVAGGATIKDRTFVVGGTGALAVTSGSLSLTAGAGLTNQGTAATTVAGMTTLGVAGASGTAGNLTVSGGAINADGGLTVEKGTLTVAGGNLTVGKTDDIKDLVVNDGGAVVIDSPDNSLSVTGSLSVSGATGDFSIKQGALDVAGAAANNGRAITVDNGGTFNIGQTLTVAGSSAAILLNSGTVAVTGATTVGAENATAGDALLRIVGGTFNANSGLSVNNWASVDVDGASARLDVAGALTVTGPGGDFKVQQGAVNVGGGATFVSRSLEVGGGATNATFDVAERLTVAGTGSGVSVWDNGTVTVTGATTIGGENATAADALLRIIGGTFNANSGLSVNNLASVDVDGANARLDVAGALTVTGPGGDFKVQQGAVNVGGSAAFVSRSLEVGGGATNATFDVAERLTVAGTGSGVSVWDNGTVTVTGATTIGGADVETLLRVANATFNANGGLTIDNGASVGFIDPNARLAVTGPLAVNGASGSLNFQQGALDVTGTAAIDGRNVTVGGTGTFSVSETLAVAGANADLSLLGGGGATVAGATTVGNAGATAADATLFVGTAGKFAAEGGLAVNKHATLRVGTGPSLAGAGAVVVGKAGAPADLTIASDAGFHLVAANIADKAVAVTGNLVIGGAAADATPITLTRGTIDVTGGATITNRSVTLGGPTADDGVVLAVRKAGSAPDVTDGTLFIAGAGRVRLANTASALHVAEVALVDQASTLVFGAAADGAYTITGAGGVEIAAPVTFELTGENTFAGGVTLTQGLLSVTNLTGIGAQGSRSLRFNGGGVHFADSFTSDEGIVFTRAGNAAVSIDAAGAGKTFTVTNLLSGQGDVILDANGGTIVLSRDNTYGGVGSKTVIRDGTLQISKIGNLGTGASPADSKRTVLVGSGLEDTATLAIEGTQLVNDDLLALTFAGSGSGLSILDAANTFTLKDQIEAIDFVKKGEGTLVLTNSANLNKSLTVAGGTVAVTKAGQLGDGDVTLAGGFLKIDSGDISVPSDAGDIASSNDALNAGKLIRFAGAAAADATLASGFDIAAAKSFTLENDITQNGGAGTVTLVKKGDGKLVLAGTGTGAQVDNILQAGTLAVTKVEQLGATATVTFAGGALGIGNGLTAAALADDTGFNLVWGGANAALDAGFDIAAESTFTIGSNALGQYDTVTGALVKKGEGTLVLANAGIAYGGGTVIEAGTLRSEGDFNFREGKYTVNGGKLEADRADLTVTALAGTARVVEKLDAVNGNSSFDPKQYELDAGTVQIASGAADDVASQRTAKLTVKETGKDGFWGRILGFFTAGADSEANPEALAGNLVVAAADKEVRLVGNASKVGTVDVTSGTLRVDAADVQVATDDTRTFRGSLTANSVTVNGTAAQRARLAGSGDIIAPAVNIGQFGTLLGDRAGTLSVKGDVTLAKGATLELGAFQSHVVAAAQPYFNIEGKLTGATKAGEYTQVVLLSGEREAGLYRVATTTGGVIGNFSTGIDSQDIQKSNLGKTLDLVSVKDVDAVRVWNGTVDETTGVGTWTAGGTDWQDTTGQKRGDLHQFTNHVVVGVIGADGTAVAAGGTINVVDIPGSEITDAKANWLTNGLQFGQEGVSTGTEEWTLTGANLALNGNKDKQTTINIAAGKATIENILTGEASLRKTGTGRLDLTGANTYKGGTIIDEGTLFAATDSVLGDAAGAITLKSSGYLGLAEGFTTNRAIRVENVESRTEDAAWAGIYALGTAHLNGELTGNGKLELGNGYQYIGQTGQSNYVFAGGNKVNYDGEISVEQGASLKVNGEGRIGTLVVDGVLHGSFGHTLTVTSLTLSSTAEVKVTLPEGADTSVSVFKGADVTLGGQLSGLDLPAGYTVGDGGVDLYLFDYANYAGGELVISDAVKARYADSNFTFGVISNGRLVLNSKSGPGGKDDGGNNGGGNNNGGNNNGGGNGNYEEIDYGKDEQSQNWTNDKFVGGQSWNHGTAVFNGTGSEEKPVNIEGLVRIAGLTINGENFLLRDAGGQNGQLYLQAAQGEARVALTVITDGSATIAIPVGGESDFVKKGAGLLTLSANSDYAKTGFVEEGTLYVTGKFSNATFEVTGGLLRVNGQAKKVTVGPDGTLEGLFSDTTGSRGVNIGTLVVEGGRLKPGNSPGTLRVGALVQNGGLIEFERGDKIEVLAGAGGTPDGQAVFAKAPNGAQVGLALSDSRGYTFGNNYTFVTAENGVTFATHDAVRVWEVGNSRLFSGFRAEAAGREGRFYLQRDRAFNTVALSANQYAVANALDREDIDGRSSVDPIYDAIASASNDQVNDVRVAFNQLSGEVHASAKGVLIDESRHLREATLNRTRAALTGSTTAAPGQVVQTPTGSNLSVWGQAYGSWGETKSTSNTAKLDRSTGGFALGFDAGIADAWRLGVAGGYAQSDIESKSNMSKADVDNYNLAVYGGGQFGNLGLRFGFGHTWHRLDTRRELNVPSLGLRDTASATYDARTLQLYGEVGYALDFNGAAVEPFVNLAYVHHNSDNFVERSALAGSSFALRSLGHNEGTGFSTLGVRLSKGFDLSGIKGTASGTIGWRHAFGDVDPQSAFISANSNNLFTVTGAPIAENALVLGVGLDVEIATGTTLGVSYNGQVGNHVGDHGVRGNFSVKF